MRSPHRRTALEINIKRSGIQVMNLSNEGVSAPAMMTSMNTNGSKSDHQTKANGVSKGSSSNFPIQTHVSQRLELLPSAHVGNLALSRCSIFISLLSNIGFESRITHVHLIRSKRSNGMMLCQIEVVARNKPSLILGCPNTAHRDTILHCLMERNMNHGGEFGVMLSVEKAEDNDASASAQWFLPLEIKDSNSAIFETIEKCFRTSGMIPEENLTEDTDDTVIKRRVLVVHASSEPWLSKYAMTEDGHKDRVLCVESAGSQECRFCQKLHSEDDSCRACHLSKPIGEIIRDRMTPSPTSLQPQLPNTEAASRPTKPSVSTTLDTKDLSNQPGAQLTETDTLSEAWKVPAMPPATLACVTISQFVADFVELNGEKRSCAATGHEIVTAFNDYIDTNFPQSSYQEKVKALRRKSREVVSTSFHPSFPALENNRHIM